MSEAWSTGVGNPPVPDAWRRGVETCIKVITGAVPWPLKKPYFLNIVEYNVRLRLTLAVDGWKIYFQHGGDAKAQALAEGADSKYASHLELHARLKSIK